MKRIKYNYFVLVLGGSRQMHEPADRSQWSGATAEVHREVLYPRPQSAGGGVHQVPVQPAGEAGPGPGSPPVQ